MAQKTTKKKQSETEVQLETKSERFKRLATRRTQKILSFLRNLGNCSNRSVYEYTDEQVDVVFNAISEAVKSAKSKFEEKKKEDTAKGFSI
jgi:hypothetical protein